MNLNPVELPSSFPQFQLLPPELRSLVWYMALPDPSEDTPAIFFHDNKFMRPWKAPEDHEAYRADGISWCSRYFYEEMDPVPVVMPVAHVNREARGVACERAPELGYALSQDNGRPVFSRGMNRSKDILYFEDGALINMLETHMADLIALGEGELHTQYHLNPSQYGICSSEAKYLEDLFNDPGDVDVAYVFLPGQGRKEWLKARPHNGNRQAIRFEADLCGGRAWAYDKNTRRWAWGPGAILGDGEADADISTCALDIFDARAYGPKSMELAPEFYIRPVRAKVVPV